MKKEFYKSIIHLNSTFQYIYHVFCIIISGAYSTLDIIYCLPDVWSRSGRNTNENKGDIFTTTHVIFNGLKVNDNPKPKRLETLGTNSF